jgi:hypothetical protein
MGNKRHNGSLPGMGDTAEEFSTKKVFRAGAALREISDYLQVLP